MMDSFDLQILLEGLFIGVLFILGFIGISRIGSKKKDGKKYEIKKVDLIFGTSAYEIFFAISSIRKEHNLQPVLVDFTMNKMARQRCEEMIKEGTLSHSLAGDEFGKLIDLGLDGVGENIAFGYHTISGLMKAWMRSESHRNNILRADWNLIGIACLKDSSNRDYYCTIFGNDKEYEENQ